MNGSITQIKDITGNPAPLGLLGFGMTTVLLNLHNAGFYELNSMILAMGLCYGGAAQIIAGIMEWKKGNTFATTAFISYGLFWLSLVTLIIIAKLGWGAPSNDTAMAAYLAMWGLFTAVMFIGTLRLNRALQIVFATSRFCFSCSLTAISRQRVPGSNISPVMRGFSADSLRFTPDSRRCSTSCSAKLCCRSAQSQNNRRLRADYGRGPAPAGSPRPKK